LYDPSFVHNFIPELDIDPVARKLHRAQMLDPVLLVVHLSTSHWFCAIYTGARSS